MLYGLPCGVDKLQDSHTLAAELHRHHAVLRLMIDHPGQLAALKRFPYPGTTPWSIFLKVDGGGL